MAGSFLCQRPSLPTPRNVARPDEADRPAPRRARIRFEDFRQSWNLEMEVEGKDMVAEGRDMIEGQLGWNGKVGEESKDPFLLSNL